MKRLNRWLNLTPQERYFLLLVTLLLVGFRLSLWIFSWKILRTVPPQIGAWLKNSLRDRVIPIAQPIWSIQVMSRYIPKATCLTQALAAQTLLLACGYDACLCLGVSLNAKNKLEAHAWVTSSDRVVIGNLPNLSRFTAL